MTTNDQCIKACLDCQTVCNQTEAHCLEMGGAHVEKDHITLMRDCAAICGLAATFMARESKFSKELCDLCADICDACAKSCEEISDDIEMRACAEMCKKCAEMCRSMES